MRNADDQKVPKHLILHLKSLFRVLKGWRIKYTEDREKGHTPGNFYTNGLCSVDVFGRQATIYPCPATVKMENYVLHEMLRR